MDRGRVPQAFRNTMDSSTFGVVGSQTANIPVLLRNGQTSWAPNVPLLKALNAREVENALLRVGNAMPIVHNPRES